jgi:hypothetical protein
MAAAAAAGAATETTVATAMVGYLLCLHCWPDELILGGGMCAEDAPYYGEPTGNASFHVTYAHLRVDGGTGGTRSGGRHLVAQFQDVDLEVLEGTMEAIVEKMYDFHEGAVTKDLLCPLEGWFLATCG